MDGSRSGASRWAFDLKFKPVRCVRDGMKAAEKGSERLALGAPRRSGTFGRQLSRRICLRPRQRDVQMWSGICVQWRTRKVPIVYWKAMSYDVALVVKIHEYALDWFMRLLYSVSQINVPWLPPSQILHRSWTCPIGSHVTECVYFTAGHSNGNLKQRMWSLQWCEVRELAREKKVSSPKIQKMSRVQRH